MNEEEMQKMMEMLKATGAGSMPAPMRLTIRYDAALQRITSTAEEPMWMGEGGTFLFALQSIFESHPEIEKQYPPGALALSINGFPPKLHSPLFDGDVINVSVSM